MSSAMRFSGPEGVELTYATSGSACVDLPALGFAIIPPGEHKLIDTGIRVAIPFGFEGQIRPRSGLALKHGITVLNSPGTIDSDYRGDVGVILANTSSKDFIVNPGDRIAQLAICKVERVDWVRVDDLSTDTSRGEGGFGSTGVSLDY